MTKIFKNEQNDTIRADDAPDDSWTEIDEAEFAAICESKRAQPDPKDAIREQIKQLLFVAGVSQDWHLDAMMAGMVALAATQGISEPDLYSVNPGYKQVKDVAEQIKALRAQL